MKTYAEVSAYYDNGSGAYSQNITSRSNAFKRQAAFPLEVYSIFPDLDTAKLYATGHSDDRPDMNFIGLPYEGQVIAVKNNGKQELYVLDQTLIDSPLSGLRKLTDFDEFSGASSNISTAVDEKIKFLSSFSATPLSGNLSVIKITDEDYLDYCNAVATSSLISNAIYIIDLSVIDVFNKRIVNIGTPINDNDAVTKKIVDDLSISLSGYFKRDIENTILCSNTFRETQNFNNISSYNLSSDNGNITNLTANNISSDNLSSTNINSQNLSADKFMLSIGSIISNYVEQSNISILTLEDKLIVEEDCYLGNSTTIHIGESNTLCTLLSNNFTPLSNAISSKIYTGTELCGNYTDLSVIKISKEDYEQKVVDAASNGVDLSDNVLYIISSNYIDAYEQQIKNVVMEDDNVPSEAVNAHYVKALSTALSTEISNLANSLSVNEVLVKNNISFGYDNVNRKIKFQIYDISGNQFSSDIDTRDFADDYVVSCARIEKINDNNYLVIYWNNDVEDPTQLSTAIPLSSISQTYKGGTGISVSTNPTDDGNDGLSYKIAVTDYVATSAQLCEASSTINTRIDNLFNSSKILNLSVHNLTADNISVDFNNIVDINNLSSVNDISASLYSQLIDLSNNGYATETWVNEHKSKVTINNDSSPADLSIYKVTSDEYANIINERDVLSNELYVIDDDEFVSVYGRQIKDVENGTSPTDAVNMQQLNAYKTQLVDMLSSAFLSAGITKETPIDSISYGHAISCIYFLAQSIMQ